VLILRIVHQPMKDEQHETLSEAILLQVEVLTAAELRPSHNNDAE
jgi:hypothetical protein